MNSGWSMYNCLNLKYQIYKNANISFNLSSFLQTMRPKSAVITNGYGNNKSSVDNAINRRSLEVSSVPNETRSPQAARDSSSTDNLSAERLNGNSFVS